MSRPESTPGIPIAGKALTLPGVTNLWPHLRSGRPRGFGDWGICQNSAARGEGSAGIRLPQAGHAARFEPTPRLGRRAR
jgi:hypothetical protein